MLAPAFFRATCSTVQLPRNSHLVARVRRPDLAALCLGLLPLGDSGAL